MENKLRIVLQQGYISLTLNQLKSNGHMEDETFEGLVRFYEKEKREIDFDYDDFKCRLKQYIYMSTTWKEKNDGIMLHYYRITSSKGFDKSATTIGLENKDRYIITKDEYIVKEIIRRLGRKGQRLFLNIPLEESKRFNIDSVEYLGEMSMPIE